MISHSLSNCISNTGSYMGTLLKYNYTKINLPLSDTNDHLLSTVFEVKIEE